MENVLKISKIVGKVINWISILALLTMIIVTVVDVFLRVVFSAPVTGSVEIVRMMMVCMSPAFVSALFLERHVSVGLLVDRLSRRTQLAFDTFGYAMSAVLCALMSYQGFVDMSRKMAQNQIYTILKMPTWPFYMIFALSMAVLSLAIIVKLISHFADKSKYTSSKQSMELEGGESQ